MTHRPNDKSSEHLHGATSHLHTRRRENLKSQLAGIAVNHEVLSTFQAGFVRGKRTLDNVFIIKQLWTNI
jgi:hypothetical protein